MNYLFNFPFFFSSIFFFFQLIYRSSLYILDFNSVICFVYHKKYIPFLSFMSIFWLTEMLSFHSQCALFFLRLLFLCPDKKSFPEFKKTFSCNILSKVHSIWNWFSCVMWGRGQISSFSTWLSSCFSSQIGKTLISLLLCGIWVNF